MYAVFETGSKQYRVSEGDKIEVEKLTAESGQTVTFDRVLLVSKDDKVAVGTPIVAGAKVVADVVENKRGEKLVVWKMKRRKGYRRKAGHRQSLTVLRVKQIVL
ncbi:MAG TPA: 50S ribosomal protein L21 [Verrucomicrobiota bacterium]|nr:50S ribosomal protein L21 [Verrucomicrobiota bacterium]